MASNSWPTPQDYNEAIQNPRACFSDPDLITGTVETNALGLPRAMTGAFASVYKISNANQSWAVRCFLTSRLDQKDRYRHISDFVLFDDLDCTIDFHYVEQGINVKGKWYPCLKMPWVMGETLDVYLYKNYKTPGKIKQLLAEFHDMVDQLECAGIGHGDLQHGNIIVTNQGLRLVDYDALYVPALLGRKSLELGHPNYQHPDRNEHHFDPDVDNFSCWLIHTSLLALAIDPQLFDVHNGGDECILFKRTDLARPEESPLFKALLNHDSAPIREATHLLQRMLWATPLAIPILDCPPECFELLPTIRNDQSPLEKLKAPVIEQEETRLVAHSPAVSRHSFDFIDDEAISIQVGARKKNKKSTSQKIKNLNQARKQLSENMLLFFSPQIWVHQHMHLALKHFDDGQYDSALNTYLRVYKMMNKKDWEQHKAFFWCLMGLGYCSGLSDKTALAGNYFLLANKGATSTLNKCRSGLCLAMIRYESDDENGALKLLSEIWRSGSDLEEAVITELQNVYILRPSFFHMLRKFGESLLTRNDGRAIEVLAAASLVFGELTKTNSIQISEESANSMLKLADLYCKKKAWPQAQALYWDLGRTAIKDGITTPGRNALFCATMIALLNKTTEEEDIRPELNLLVASFAQESNPKSFGPRLRNMIGFAVDFEPALIVSALTYLCLRFLTENLRLQALVTAKTAFKITIERKLPLTKRLIALIGALGEVDGWECLSTSYLGEDNDVRPLLDFLCETNDIVTLKYLAHRLASEKKTVPLSIMLMHFAMHYSEKFAELCNELIEGLPRHAPARGELFSTLDRSGQCFVTNLNLLFDEQPSEIRTANQILDSQLQHLNAIALIRTFLKSHGYEIEAQAYSNLMMRLDNSQLLMIWMLKLLSEQESHRFIEFILDPIEYDLASVNAFVLHLSEEKTNSGLELFISGLRQWGLPVSKLEAILLSTATLCCERLTSLLDIEPIDDEALVQTRALYRLKAIAVDLRLEGRFNSILSRLYQPVYFESLSDLLNSLDKTDDASLMQAMTIDMLDLDNDKLLQVLVLMAITQPDKAIIGVCRALLKNDRAPLVASIATHPEVKKKGEFFKTLALVVTKKFSDEIILTFVDELLKQDYKDGVATFIRNAKLLTRSELLLKLLSKCSLAENLSTTDDQIPSGQQDAIAAMVLLSDLSGLADLVHLAALSGERRLSVILCDLDKNGLKTEQRHDVLKIVVYRCADSLSEYCQRLKKQEDQMGRLNALAVLNIAALNRLSALLAPSKEPNQAIALLQSPDNRDFVINWLLDLAATGDTDKIADFIVDAAKLNNLPLVDTIFLRLAQVGFLRTLIVTSRKLCTENLSPVIVGPIKRLVENGLVDAFGSVCLEAVSNLNSTQTTLLEIIQNLSGFDKSYMRIALRQIFFYRGLDVVERLYHKWSYVAPETSLVMLNEMRELGYVS